MICITIETLNLEQELVVEYDESDNSITQNVIDRPELREHLNFERAKVLEEFA